MTAPVIEAYGIEVRYSRSTVRGRSVVHALRGVDVSVFPRELVALVGESGSGKSTLGRVLVRLVRPCAGIVRIQGREVQGLSDRAYEPYRRVVQFVFQDPYGSLNPKMRIGPMLMEPLRMIGAQDPKARAEALLSAVGLSAEDMTKFPHEFSGGQRQRIGIARALAPDPKVLVLDEPVSALDVSIRAQVLNLLMSLRDRFGLAMLFIGHDLDIVQQIADRILVMREGQIVETLPTSDLGRATHPYTKALLRAIPSRIRSSVQREL